MQAHSTDTANVWTAWLIGILLFTAFVITMAVNAVMAPQEPIGGRDIFLMAVGVILAGIGFVNFVRGSVGFPNERIRVVTLAIVYGCAFASVVSLAVAVGHRL